MISDCWSWYCRHIWKLYHSYFLNIGRRISTSAMDGFVILKEHTTSRCTQAMERRAMSTWYCTNQSSTRLPRSWRASIHLTYITVMRLDCISKNSPTERYPQSLCRVEKEFGMLECPSSSAVMLMQQTRDHSLFSVSSYYILPWAVTPYFSNLTLSHRRPRTKGGIGR